MGCRTAPQVRTNSGTSQFLEGFIDESYSLAVLSVLLHPLFRSAQFNAFRPVSSLTSAHASAFASHIGRGPAPDRRRILRADRRIHRAAPCCGPEALPRYALP